MSLSILFEHFGLVAHFMSAVAQHVVVQGVRFSSQGDLDRGLVGQGALHGRAQDRHHQVGLRKHRQHRRPRRHHHRWHHQHHPPADSFLVLIPRNVAEILRLVQAFRHSDLTGQVGEIDRTLLNSHWAWLPNKKNQCNLMRIANVVENTNCYSDPQSG